MYGDLWQTKEGLSYVHLHIQCIYLNVDVCWLTSCMQQQRFKLQIMLKYAVIPENVVSED